MLALVDGGVLNDRLPAERFNEVVLPHLGDALSLARWLTGNAVDAEDVVQEACINAFNGIGTYAGGSARVWLLTIVRRTSYRWLERNRSRREKSVGNLTDLEEAASASGISADLEAGPDAELMARASSTILEAALAAVPEPFRETLILRDMNELSYREIAEVLGVPIGTVMSRLARARGLLKKELEKRL